MVNLDRVVVWTYDFAEVCYVPDGVNERARGDIIGTLLEGMVRRTYHLFQVIEGSTMQDEYLDGRVWGVGCGCGVG